MGCTIDYINKECCNGKDKEELSIPKDDTPIENIYGSNQLDNLNIKKQIYKKNWLQQNEIINGNISFNNKNLKLNTDDNEKINIENESNDNEINTEKKHLNKLTESNFEFTKTRTSNFFINSNINEANLNLNEHIKKESLNSENTDLSIINKSSLIKDDNIILGINIGSFKTVYSTFSYNNGKYEPKILLMNNSSRTIPSIICYTKTHRLFGENSLSSLKQNLNTSYNNLSRIFGFDNNIKLYEKEYKFALKKINNNSEYKFFFYVEDNSETKISTNNLITDFLDLINEYYFTNEKIKYTSTSLSVPDYYSFELRRNLRLICEGLNMKDVNLFTESSAITMYYGYMKYKELFIDEQNKINHINQKNILFIDAGHSKTSFILSNFKYNEFKVEYVLCNPYFGGRNFNYLIAKYCILKFKQVNNFEKVIIDDKMKYKLLEEIRKARENLSVTKEVIISIDSFYNNCDLNIHFTRDKFENIYDYIFNILPKKITRNLFEEFQNDLNKVLEYAKKNYIFIDYVEIAGELMKTPILQTIIENNNLRVNKNITIDECTSIGASLLNHFSKGNFPIKHLKNFYFYNYYPLLYEIVYDINKITHNVLLPKGTVDYKEKIIKFINYSTVQNKPVILKLYFPDNEKEAKSENNFYFKYIIDINNIFEDNKNILNNKNLIFKITVNDKLAFSLGHFYIGDIQIKKDYEVITGDIYKIKIKDKDLFKRNIRKYAKYQEDADLEYKLYNKLSVMKNSLRKSINDEISEINDIENKLKSEHLNMESLKDIQNKIDEIGQKIPKK